MYGLTKRQLQYAYRVAENPEETGLKSAIESGYAPASASEMSSLNLQNPKVINAIGERRAQLAAAAGLTPEFILREWMLIAMADPRELVHTRVGCCRYCWGLDHKREWMEHEYATALHEALLNNFLPPDFEGGLGYRPTRDPNAECPQCDGEGLARNVITDSRKLSPAALKLFAGSKQTKDGIEIKLHDQKEARDNIAKYLGMLVDRKELSGPGGGPIELSATARPQEMSDDQLLALCSAGSSEPLQLEAENL